MEILNSGSFVPLDNRDKIEQLIFTARTLAAEVSRIEGFQSSGQTNQQMGLELWNGAEYMTRSHEEVTIRNIFLSKFLERLREIEREPVHRAAMATESPIPIEEANGTSHTELAPPAELADELGKSHLPKDEYLGVVDSEDEDEARPSYANECIPECEEEIASIMSSAGTSSVADLDTVQSGAQTSPEPIEERVGLGNSVAQTALEIKSDDTETDVDSVVESENAIQTSEDSSSVPEDHGSVVEDHPIKSVVLSDKEPYNFDSCTVTAVIQLLPEVEGIRDCLLSVRSHDFAPQIIFSNVTGGDSRSDLSARLSDALEQYRTALPGLAAEKLKKEKAPAKKRTSKAADTTTKVNETATAKNTQTASVSNPAAQEKAKDQQDLFAS